MEVKNQYKDCILFYRLGDFYEMFFDDAELAARVLGITLTSRGDGVPLAGVPVKAAADYLRQLIAAGMVCCAAPLVHAYWTGMVMT
jgi:DNA mismatch repair protein MutS